MVEEAFCDNLKQNSIKSSQSTQRGRECYAFDADFSFRHQRFVNDSELREVQSSAMMRSVCKQSHRFNASKALLETNSKQFQSLNHKCYALKKIFFKSLLETLTR